MKEDYKDFNPITIKKVFYEMIKDLKWHQKLYLKAWYKINSLWNKILYNTIYRNE